VTFTRRRRIVRWIKEYGFYAELASSNAEHLAELSGAYNSESFHLRRRAGFF
jgi:hypothetical protein